jgi:hypothetical protein
MRHISIAVCSEKRPARPPTDHLKRLFEEVCLNHAYPVRHKLKDGGIVRSFMTSGSLTWGAKLDEGLDGSDMTLFSEENTIMMIYRGRPPLGRHRVCGLSPKAPTHCG